MTTEDLRRTAETGVEQSTDARYQQLVLLSMHAVQRWAHVRLTGEMELSLWPRTRGPADSQTAAYRVTQRTAEQGVWRITLCREDNLPAGVPMSTRDALLRSEISRSVMELRGDVADHVVQCGLFGEVLYA